MEIKIQYWYYENDMCCFHLLPGNYDIANISDYIYEYGQGNSKNSGGHNDSND